MGCEERKERIHGKAQGAGRGELRVFTNSHTSDTHSVGEAQVIGRDELSREEPLLPHPI